MNNIEKIGGSIRSHRKLKGMTLQELSEVTGLSIGYLSNLERNASSPTLINVQKICDALNISFFELLERNKEQNVIIRKNAREKVLDEENNMILENIDFGLSNASFLYMTVEPNSLSNGVYFEHKYNEVGTMLQGRLILELENDRFELEEGDTVLIKAHTKHCIYNIFDEKSISYWTKDIIAE